MSRPASTTRDQGIDRHQQAGRSNTSPIIIAVTDSQRASMTRPGSAAAQLTQFSRKLRTAIMNTSQHNLRCANESLSSPV